jgi:hypothetical protein
MYILNYFSLLVLLVLLTEIGCSQNHVTAAEMYNAINKHQLQPLSNSTDRTAWKVVASCCDKEFQLHNTVVSK